MKKQINLWKSHLSCVYDLYFNSLDQLICSLAFSVNNREKSQGMVLERLNYSSLTES